MLRGTELAREDVREMATRMSSVATRTVYVLGSGCMYRKSSWTKEDILLYDDEYATLCGEMARRRGVDAFRHVER